MLQKTPLMLNIENYTVKYDGDLYTHKEHTECAEAAANYMGGDIYHEGDLVDAMTYHVVSYNKQLDLYVQSIGDLSRKDRIVWSRITRTRIRQECDQVLKLHERKRLQQLKGEA